VNYILSKLLPLFILPPGCFFILCIIGWVVRKRYSKAGNIIIGTAFAILYVSALPWVSGGLVNYWESKQAQQTTINKDSVHIAVVLGGIFETTPNDQNLYMLNDAVDRIFKSVHMINKGTVDRLVYTGGGVPVSPWRQPEAHLMADFIERHNLVPDSLIWIENKAINTYENAKLTRELLLQKGVEQPLNVYLITSALHMPRAKMMFRHFNINVIPAPTDYKVIDQYDRPAIFSVIPEAYSLLHTSMVIREWLGVQYYKLKFMLYES